MSTAWIKKPLLQNRRTNGFSPILRLRLQEVLLPKWVRARRPVGSCHQCGAGLQTVTPLVPGINPGLAAILLIGISMEADHVLQRIVEHIAFNKRRPLQLHGHAIDERLPLPHPQRNPVHRFVGAEGEPICNVQRHLRELAKHQRGCPQQHRNNLLQHTNTSISSDEHGGAAGHCRE